MRKNYRLTFSVLMAAMAALAVVAAAFAAPQKEAPKVIGSKEESKWTKTTQDAANTPENKAALGKGKPVTVTGEIVDASCYVQLGKRGAAHIDCGRQCIMNGQPIGIVDAKNVLYIIMAEQHDPRKQGKVDIKKTFADLLGKQATVHGILNDNGGVKTIFVQGKVE